MLECLILGDSIAVGTHAMRPECVAFAKSGIDSATWARRWKNADLSARAVIISLGTNDFAVHDAKNHLRDIRSRVKSHQVFWIMPNYNHTNLQVIQTTIRMIAQEHGDMIICTQRLSPDHIHPTSAGYRDLAVKSR